MKPSASLPPGARATTPASAAAATDSVILPATGATAAPAPVMRCADSSASALLASLSPEFHALIFSQLESHTDRNAIAQASKQLYASGHAQRSLEFFLTHCHQIAALPGDAIADLRVSSLSQPLLDAAPGATTLVALVRLHCLLEQAGPELDDVGDAVVDRTNDQIHQALQQLGQLDSDMLCAALRLFAHWAQAYAPAPGDRMPFLNADFLATGPLLAHVEQLSKKTTVPDAQIVLTETLLTWTAHHGHQHLLMDVGVDTDPLPACWYALSQLIDQLMQHCRTHPQDRRVTPALLLHLISWCHLVQESGLLHSRATHHHAQHAFLLLDLSSCVPVLLEKLAKLQQADREQQLAVLAAELLQRQAAAHRTQAANLPHMASLRSFSVLLEAGSAALATASAAGIALFSAAIEATRKEFERFAQTVHTHPVAGFDLHKTDPALRHAPTLLAEDIIGWACVDELIEFYHHQWAGTQPHPELLDKLFGYANDPQRGFHDAVAGQPHALSHAQVCRLRLIDSMLATVRELSTRLMVLPAPALAPLAGELRDAVRWWPLKDQQDAIANWIPDAQ